MIPDYWRFSTIMADTNPHHGHDPVEQHPERHEQSDVSIKSLTLFLIIFATVLVGTMIGLVYLYTGFDSLAWESRVPRSAVQAEPVTPAIPLQGIPGYHDNSPARDTELYIQAQKKLLATGGPTTQPGFVRIPIDEAMQIVIDRKMLVSRPARKEAP
jgi:hypothetical protein